MAFVDAQSGASVYALAADYPITLAGTVVRGDILGYSSGWQRALGEHGSGIILPRVVALEDGVSGDVIKVCPTALVGGRFSGATIGGSVYVARSTDSGKYTQTRATWNGDSIAVLGHAVTADMVLVVCGGNLDWTV